MRSFQPEVNAKSEFLEISVDFGNPLEIFREAISNSLDAQANTIIIDVYIDKASGIDELVIGIKDDGEGVSEEELKSFFGLGFSTRLKFDERGYKISGSIGEKGHGTKIFYNSRRIELVSIKNKKKIIACMDSPMQKLRNKSADMPTVEYDIYDTDEKDGTYICIYGYNSNDRSRFSHNEIADYINWFTKFGSSETELGINIHKNKKLLLRGLGRVDFDKPITYGHIFPEENYNISELKKIDKVSPLDWYVAKWIFKNRQVIDYANTYIDIVFYLEGDKAKRQYNKMVHEPNTARTGGVYNVEERYGLWLCKDFIPIELRNKWVSQKSEFTKYHAFVNCQDIQLTANRGDAGNTASNLIDKIAETVKQIFENEIEKTPKYIKYQDEFDKIKKYRSLKKEEEDFQRRKRAALKKKASKYSDVLILEPRQECGVFSIVTQLLTIDPNIFGFKVIDYDTKEGYDLLVTKNYCLDLNNASMLFVEMKHTLQNTFDHSFQKLACIICWDTDLSDDYEVEDMAGEKRKMKITPKSKSKDNYTKFMLVSDTEDHNIEVFVLRRYLEEKIDCKFVLRAELDV